MERQTPEQRFQELVCYHRVSCIIPVRMQAANGTHPAHQQGLLRAWYPAAGIAVLHALRHAGLRRGDTPCTWARAAACMLSSRWRACCARGACMAACGTTAPDASKAAPASAQKACRACRSPRSLHPCPALRGTSACFRCSRGRGRGGPRSDLDRYWPARLCATQDEQCSVCEIASVQRLHVCGAAQHAALHAWQ